ncbi:hypothetical protein DY000_02015511 [Brassica cretica]|uniref:Uncharacterized protein n=1 Tax=Brassica cretica TaxID=69181 RepID=A0ABQ7DB41_BRACR|nr:hypothetical protein DY000_02015511 [Brassica cretica]
MSYCRSCSDGNLVTTTTISISPIRYRSSPPPPPSLLRCIFTGLRLHRSCDHHRPAHQYHRNKPQIRLHPLSFSLSRSSQH